MTKEPATESKIEESAAIRSSDDVVAAVGKPGEALEWVERARGRLYDLHQLIGRADFLFEEAADELEPAGVFTKPTRRRRVSCWPDRAGAGAGVFARVRAEERRDLRWEVPRCAGAPPESGPPPFPGGTRTFPPTRASRSAGLSPTHLGVDPRSVRGVEAVRPTPRRSSDGTPLLRGGPGLFDEHFAS
jgi:hypothetical protein